MGQVIDFVLKHWIIIIIIFIILLAIIGYIVESHNLNKNKKQIKSGKDEDIQYVQMQTYNKSLNDDDIIFENVKDLENKNTELTVNLSKNKMYDEEEKQEIKESINEIIENKDLTLNDKDKEILKNKPAKDIKEQFDDLEYEIAPIKKPKIRKNINTDIKLPKIDLGNDKDIWS